MVATTLICMISTMAFCLCSRLLMEVIGSQPKPAWVLSGRKTPRYSAAARRVARGYAAFAIVILMGLSAAGAAFSFIELFTHAVG